MTDITPEDRQALVSQATHYLRKWEAAEAECHRLREERLELVERHGELVERALIAESDLATECAAHEATRAQLTDAVTLAMGRASAETFYAEVGARKAAEQRVAELKRELVEQELRHVRTREERAALSSARELLEDVITHNLHHMPAELETRLIAWLRAHPEPANPAATGAENCKRCGLLKSECDAQKAFPDPDPFGAAEKEQGT